MQLLGTMLGILVTVTGGHASTEVPLGKGCSDGCARPPKARRCRSGVVCALWRDAMRPSARGR
jgi:hypothetical protein